MALPADMALGRRGFSSQKTQATVSIAEADTQCALGFLSSTGCQTDAEFTELEAAVTPMHAHPDKEAKPAQSLKPHQPGGRAVVPVANLSAEHKGSQREAHIAELQRLLTLLSELKPPKRRFATVDEAEDPASVPVFWISKWIDYTEKYGFGYQLWDNSIGVLFNDNTRMVLLSNKMSVTYVDENSLENYYTLEEYPSALKKKMTLLGYFCSYMQLYLHKTGEDVAPRKCDNLACLPYVGSWFRTRSAISFYLTNGTVQINFFLDHTKLILCPLMAAVSYIDHHQVFHTYRLETLQTLGCPSHLYSRLKYARTIVERFT